MQPNGSHPILTTLVPITYSPFLWEFCEERDKFILQFQKQNYERNYLFPYGMSLFD